MDADHTVDDELQSRQAYAFVRQAGKVKGAVRVADVHHDLQRQIRHRANTGALHAEVEDFGIHVAGITFRAGDGHVLVFLDAIGGVAAANHRRDPQLTRDNRRMTGTPAAVGDDRRRFFHDRFPVRVGHVGHQHVAGLDAVHFADIVNDLYRTRADAMADSAPFRNNLSLRMEGITLHDLTARTDGFWTGLHDK